MVKVRVPACLCLLAYWRVSVPFGPLWLGEGSCLRGVALAIGLHNEPMPGWRFHVGPWALFLEVGCTGSAWPSYWLYSVPNWLCRV